MKIIVISSQFVGNGGCGTLSYGLIKYLFNKNHKVFGLFVNPSMANVDPENIGNIILIKQKIKQWLCNDNLRKRLNDFFEGVVDYVIYTDLSAYPLKQIFPNAKYIYLISRLPLKYKHMSAVDILKLEKHDDTINKIDYDHLSCANIIVPNSLLMKDIYETVYPQHKEKLLNNVIDTSKYVYQLDSLIRQNNSEKEYDIILVANHFDRKEKNFGFIFNILTDTRFDKFTKRIIGKIDETLIQFPLCSFTGFVSHDEAMENMHKSKVLIIPSLCESSGNVIREAIVCNTLPLLSINVGFHERFPEEFVCKTFNNDEWITKLIYLLENYDKLKALLSGISFETGCDILDLLK